MYSITLHRAGYLKTPLSYEINSIYYGALYHSQYFSITSVINFVNGYVPSVLIATENISLTQSSIKVVWSLLVHLICPNAPQPQKQQWRHTRHFKLATTSWPWLKCRYLFFTIMSNWYKSAAHPEEKHQSIINWQHHNSHKMRVSEWRKGFVQACPLLQAGWFNWATFLTTLT